MLRASVTKFKACSLAHIPRILRKDVWCSTCNIEKLSAILMKYKSTTSGSNDDEDKKDKKCKRLIELAFGPDKLDAAERIENIDLRKIDELESMVSPDTGKVLCEKDNRIEAEQNKELDRVSIVEADGNTPQEDAKTEKCKQLIELVFGPDKQENLVGSNTSKVPELENENIAQMVTPASTKSETMNSNINILKIEGLNNQEMDSNRAKLQNVNATKAEDEEKLVQKIEKIEESPLVEADISRKRHFMYSHKNGGNKRRQMKDSRTMFEEIAQRCINSSNDQIDNKILKEMKRLGISQPLLQDMPTDNSENTQTTNSKSKETPRDKDNIKIGRRNTVDRRALKRFSMRMVPNNITDNTAKMSKKDLPPVKDSNSRVEHEILIDREKSPNLTETVAASAVQRGIEKLVAEKAELEHQSVIKSCEDHNKSPAILNIEKETQNKAAEREIKSLNTEKTQVQYESVMKSNEDQRGIEKLVTEKTELEHQSLIKSCEDNDRAPAVLNVEKESKNKAAEREIEILNTEKTQDQPFTILNKEKATNNIDTQNESTEVSNENVGTADVKNPALLAKEYNDPDDFRITPNDPNEETHTSRLNTLNNKVYHSTFISGSSQPQKTEQISFKEESDSSKMNNAFKRGIETLNTEKTQVQHRPPAILSIEKAKKNIDTQNESIVTSNENIGTNDVKNPALLVNEYNDPDDFRITPNTPNENTLTSRLNTLNNKVYHSTFISGSSQPTLLDNQKTEQISFKKVSDSSKINKAFECEIDTLNAEKTQSQHQSPAILNIEKAKDSIDTQDESIVTSNENVGTADVTKPALLVKEYNDPDDFRITPNTPKAETLINRLNTLNNQVQHSTFISGSSQPIIFEDQKTEQLSFKKESDISKMNRHIEKLFSDERIPRHLFADLTVITKNLPTHTEFGKTLKAFYEQDLEEKTLIKPDRLQYYSHNDEILEFRDCSLEVDPHVVIRKYDDYESDPTVTDPYSNNNSDFNYNNNQRNLYDHGYMHQNNMPPGNHGTYQNMTHYNRMMTNTFSFGYNNMWDSVTGYNKESSENSNFKNQYDTNKLYSTINPNDILFDPYGKKMKPEEWEECEDSNPNSTNANENNQYSNLGLDNQNNTNINEKNQCSDLGIDPLLTSRFAVNDGTLVSGNESIADDQEPKARVNKEVQTKQKSTKILYPWIDKGTISGSSVNCNAYIDAQEPVKMSETPVVIPKEEKVSLKEMLRKARERARLESYSQEVWIAPPVTEVEPAEGSCKKPKPPCPPPQKTCPPTPPKCPPSNCPEPKPPCPKPCKPVCPDPCPTPKCPDPPKKDPCAKFVNDKTVDILGLVVTLGTLDIPQGATVKFENNNVIPLFIEDIMLRVYAIADGVLMPEMNSKQFDNKVRYLPDVVVDRSYYYPKDYEPWTPIPSWPIPPKRVKNKLVCPKDGCRCRVPGPPAPGSPCKNIHHPCAGFPNDKKRT